MGRGLAVHALPQVRVGANTRAWGQGLAQGVSLEQGVVFRKPAAEPARRESREATLSPSKMDRRGVGCLVGDAGAGGQGRLGELPPPTSARGASTRC